MCFVSKYSKQQTKDHREQCVYQTTELSVSFNLVDLLLLKIN